MEFMNVHRTMYLLKYFCLHVRTYLHIYQIHLWRHLSILLPDWCLKCSTCKHCEISRGLCLNTSEGAHRSADASRCHSLLQSSCALDPYKGQVSCEYCCRRRYSWVFQVLGGVKITPVCGKLQGSANVQQGTGLRRARHGCGGPAGCPWA